MIKGRRVSDTMPLHSPIISDARQGLAAAKGEGLAPARGASTFGRVLMPLVGLLRGGYSERGHRVHRVGARLSEEGYLSPRQGALVERHLSPLSPLGTLVSVVSVVSVLSNLPAHAELMGVIFCA